MSDPKQPERPVTKADYKLNHPTVKRCRRCQSSKPEGK